MNSHPFILFYVEISLDLFAVVQLWLETNMEVASFIIYFCSLQNCLRKVIRGSIHT
jgi:hypothetical protein